MHRGSLVGLAVAMGCRAHAPLAPGPTEGSAGVVAPVPPPFDLVVTQPARGAYADGPTIVVGGTVVGGPHPKVTVGGVDAMVGPDGTFALAVPATPGLMVLETHARDATGRDLRDVRAALVGPFAVADGKVRAPIAARIERGGLTALAGALGASAGAIDFTAAAKTADPLFDEGDCLGARVTTDHIDVGAVTVGLTPNPGGLAAVIDVANIAARFAVHYEVACIGGDATIVVHARARVTGDLGAALRPPRGIQTSLANTAVALDDLEVDIAHVPGPIERLLRRALRGSVERALARTIEVQVPPLVDARLGALLAVPLAPPPLLGHALAIDVVPRRLDLDAGGIYLAADTAFVVGGGEGGRYAARPTVLPAAPTAPVADLDLWIATDAIDQLLAGLWAAHAFDQTIEISQLGALAFLLGGKLATIDLVLALPPTASIEHGAVALAIGDLVLVARDADHREVQRFAVTVRTALAPNGSGAIALAATAPTIFAQEIAAASPAGGSGVDVAPAGPLDAAGVETLARTAWTLLAGSLDDALVRLPVPALQNRALVLRALPSPDGVAVFGASLR